MGWVLPILVAFLAVNLRVASAETCANSDAACEWEAITNGKKYTFNLLTPIKANPHGILSEEGYYKVSTDGGKTHYWFQLCEHMKFNFNPPRCENCEACGGPNHCGETCSALTSSVYPGYSVCTTLGYAGSTKYSLINANKPEQGVRVGMNSCNKLPKTNCSFSVLVSCDRSGAKAPDTVINKTPGGCDYETILKHPAGCPVVTKVNGGGWGWFSSLIFMLVVAFVVYMAIGIAYRVTVLGVSGFEAIPNLDVWRTLPSKIQLCVSYIYEQCMGLYYRVTENSYSQLNT